MFLTAGVATMGIVAVCIYLVSINFALELQSKVTHTTVCVTNCGKTKKLYFKNDD